MPRHMNVDAVAATLGRVPLFGGLPPQTLLTLSAAAHAVVLKKNGRLCEEGSPADGCFVVASGRLKVVLSGPGGSEYIIGILGPDALAGEVALIDGSARSASLVAAEESRVIKVPKRSFDALRKNAAFDERLLVHVTATLRRATERLRAIYTFDSADRLLWCLAQIARDRGRAVGHTIHIAPKPSHQELGEMAGCSRETVSRTLRRLKDLRRLNWDGRSYRLDSRFLRGYYLDDDPEIAESPDAGIV